MVYTTLLIIRGIALINEEAKLFPEFFELSDPEDEKSDYNILNSNIGDFEIFSMSCRRDNTIFFIGKKVAEHKRSYKKCTDCLEDSSCNSCFNNLTNGSYPIREIYYHETGYIVPLSEEESNDSLPIEEFPEKVNLEDIDKLLAPLLIRLSSLEIENYYCLDDCLEC